MPKKRTDAALQEKSISQLFFKHFIQEQEVAIRRLNTYKRRSIKKDALRNFVKFTGKHLCQSLFLIKLQGSGLQLYLKNDSGTGVLEGVHLLKIPENYL